MSERQSLTKNQQLVLRALQESKAPLSAYSILDVLRPEGFRAPLQVYRALEKLIETGAVHRLESLNAYVACSHPECDAVNTVAFTICEKCDRVEEITDAKLANRLQSIASTGHFELTRSTVELKGLCSRCPRPIGQ